MDLIVPGMPPTCDATADFGDPWCDDFESYEFGPIYGYNWEGWGGDFDALGFVTGYENHTPGGSKSLEIIEHDTVRLFHGYDLSESSAWILSAWVYIPSSMTGTAHFIVNPDYTDGGVGTTWAMNLEMNTAAGTINSNEAFASLPLVTNAWVEIRLEIDFARDSAAIYYDDDFLARHTWSNEGGSLSISAIDLWSPDSSGHYYDDFAFYPTTSVDGNGNGVPDECDCFPSSPAEPELLDLELNPVSQKIRYLSFSSGDAGQSQAIRVTFDSLPSPYSHWNGTELWVQEPQVYCENAGVAQDYPCPEAVGELPSVDFWGAQLGCDPHWTDWTAFDVVHVWNEGIIPGASYDIQVVADTCSLASEESYSTALTLTQSSWADLIQDCTTTPCKPPDGSTGIVDVTAILDKWKNLPGNVMKVRADIEGSPAGDHRVPDQAINITDVTYCLGAFLGDTYPGPGFPAPSDPPSCGP